MYTFIFERHNSAYKQNNRVKHWKKKILNTIERSSHKFHIDFNSFVIDSSIAINIIGFHAWALVYNSIR